MRATAAPTFDLDLSEARTDRAVELGVLVELELQPLHHALLLQGGAFRGEALLRLDASPRDALVIAARARLLESCAISSAFAASRAASDSR